jgi:hypothetical protein
VTATLATAADARSGRWLLNMLGSVQRRSPLFDRIVAYDLGLTPFQRRLLAGVRGVEVREVPPFVPHWQQGRTWKTWIWAHVEGDAIVWLDAGLTVLRPLTDFLRGVDERGYFVVSQGGRLGDSVPSDYYALLGVDPAVAEADPIAAGILAFRRGGPFDRDVVGPTYADASRGLSLGFSAAEAATRNWGLDALPEPIVRDCPTFRHEQTLLGLHFYASVPEPVVGDVYRYAGFRGPHDHPEQVIWSHRRNGDLRFLPRVRYRPRLAPVGLAWGAAAYARWALRRHGWVFRPSIYRAQLRRLARVKES